MEPITEFWNQNPQLWHLRWIPVLYIGIYGLALFATHLVMSLRRKATRVPADRIAHNCLFYVFVIAGLGLPFYFCFLLGSDKLFPPQWWHFIPYVLIILINGVMSANLFAVRSSRG